MYSRVFVGVKKKERKIWREKAQEKKEISVILRRNGAKGVDGVIEQKGMIIVAIVTIHATLPDVCVLCCQVLIQTIQ